MQFFLHLSGRRNGQADLPGTGKKEEGTSRIPGTVQGSAGGFTSAGHTRRNRNERHSFFLRKKNQPFITALSRTPSSGSGGHRLSPRRLCRSSAPARISRTHGYDFFGWLQGFRACSCDISCGTACPVVSADGTGTHRSRGGTCPGPSCRQRSCS